MTSQELLDQIQKLPTEERQRLLDVLSRGQRESRHGLPGNGDDASSMSPASRLEAETLRSMLAEGLISHLPEGITDEEDDFEPVEVSGRSISETIIEERR